MFIHYGNGIMTGVNKKVLMTSGECLDKQRETVWIIVGLCATVMSSIIVEVCLTKFVSYKVFYHYVYAIISTVVLSSGFAGTCVHLYSKRFGKDNSDPWKVASRSALLYAITLVAVVLAFCWLPVDVYPELHLPKGAGQLALWSNWTFIYAYVLQAPLFFYFLLLSVPFFFAGLAISITLAISKRPIGVIYAWDLFSAAVAALISPWLLENLGGYGAIALGSVLGAIAFCSFAKAATKQTPSIGGCVAVGVAVALLLAYPGWAISKYGFDIVTTKDRGYREQIKSEYSGIAKTYWNPVGRIDITPTNWTHYFETNPGDNVVTPFKIQARFVLVDGSGLTRQAKADGDLLKEPNLGHLLWASPYYVKPNVQHALIIGTGGGIDILISKIFKVPLIDALEINPSTYKHLLLGQGDREADAYQPWLVSSPTSTVRIYNSEARHYCSSQPDGSVDLIHATGVDTLAGINTGALALAEGYLYTSDAVAEYMRLLSDDGLLSLTHWRVPGNPSSSLRMFATYLQYLDQAGVKEPWRNVVMLTKESWTDEMMQKKPFTEEQIDRLRQFAKANGFVILFDPLRKETMVPGMYPAEAVYAKLAFASPEERRKIFDDYNLSVSPVSDDKPFFYHLRKSNGPFYTDHGGSIPLLFFVAVIISSLFLFLLPLRRLNRVSISEPLLVYVGAFAMAGFAFLLFEVTIMQALSIFVGGPIYSMCAVLVSVLGGYSLGGWLSNRMSPTPRTFLMLGGSLAGLFLALYCQLPTLIHHFLPLSDPMRIALSIAVTLCVSIPIGMCSTLAMTAVKRDHDDAVAWLWGISCGSNALGAMSFAFIAQSTGVLGAFMIIAVLYLLANCCFAFLNRCSAQKQLMTV
jgi:hypothetical protein